MTREKLTGVLLPALFMIWGCKKHAFDQPPVVANSQMTTTVLSGLPERYDSINGFFYVTYKTMTAVSWTPQVTLRKTIALFAEPASGLYTGFNHYSQFEHGGTAIFQPGGNIAAGIVTAMSDTLPRIETQEFSVQYRRLADTVRIHEPLPDRFIWRFTGNKSFTGATVELVFPFAKIADSFDTLRCFGGTDNVIHLDSLLEKADSAAIGFLKPGLTWSTTGIRSIPGDQSKVILNKDEVEWLEGALANSSITHINLRGIRYYHKWEMGRLFLFVFSTERQVPIVFKD